MDGEQLALILQENASYKAIARRIFTFSSILFGLCFGYFLLQALESLMMGR